MKIPRRKDMPMALTSSGVWPQDHFQVPSEGRRIQPVFIAANFSWNGFGECP
jgi:hypothetical protein